jgi:hypothetical protein
MGTDGTVRAMGVALMDIRPNVGFGALLVSGRPAPGLGAKLLFVMSGEGEDMRPNPPNPPPPDD